MIRERIESTSRRTAFEGSEIGKKSVMSLSRKRFTRSSLQDEGNDVQQMTQLPQHPLPCSSAVASAAVGVCAPAVDNRLAEFALMVALRVFFLNGPSSAAGGGAFRIHRWTTVLVTGDGGVQEGKDRSVAKVWIELRSAHDTLQRVMGGQKWRGRADE